MDQDTPAQSFEFRAEVRKLLEILVHSLYTEREIFLRELISNASDALNRIQFEMLTNRDVLDPDLEPAIQIDFDDKARTLTVSDTGIGMTRAEMIENLGTLARSGVSAFLKQVESGTPIKADVIGQFGVGFYSVFMVADEVKVTSRSYRQDAAAHAWISRGDETFQVEPAERAQRGTTVEIKLKEDAAELASNWRLEQIIKKHSDFTSFPIQVKDKQVNRQTALWRQSPREVTGEQYGEFYRSLTLDMEEPLARVQISVDAPVHIQAILYVPAKRERGLLSLRKDDGLKLYSRKVLIQEYNTDLLPQHLRFVVGVVDSEDLPLNVSRETVQSTRVVERIRTVLTNRLIDELERVAAEEAEKYHAFWREFGPYLKEGISLDPGARTSLAKLLRFPSSKSEGDGLTSLAQYVERMPAEQQSIYYILGSDLKSVAHSPHLDYFRRHAVEVLYLVDPLDSFLVTAMRDFDGKPLQNVDDAGLELPKDDQAPAGEAVAEDEFAKLLDRFGKVLGERVAEVRSGQTLTDSPCRLVSPKDATDRDMARVRRLLNQDYQAPKKIMELNRAHPLMHNLAQLVKERPEDAIIDASIEQLYDSALLVDGLHPNPADMVGRIQQLMEAATDMKRQRMRA
ncbi:MAG TPA: molecular chaperone HtpG [Anaerolineae bacterium]|nr:molecular chaperone HtpG [Anaerolineae bacterium]